MIVAHTADEFHRLGPGHYVAIGHHHTLCWVDYDDPIVTIQRRINHHKLNGKEPSMKDLDAITQWWVAAEKIQSGL